MEDLTAKKYWKSNLWPWTPLALIRRFCTDKAIFIYRGPLSTSSCLFLKIPYCPYFVAKTLWAPYLIDPKSQRSTFSLLGLRELGYPKTFITKIGILKSITEICTNSLFFCSYLLHYHDWTSSKPRKPIFKSDFQIIVNCCVTNCDSLKIHTETIY